MQLVFSFLSLKNGKYSTEEIVCSWSVIDISVGKNHYSER